MQNEKMQGSDKLPEIIQGGMGAGVSDWNLAKTVSKLGHLGVVSGTAIDTIIARRLQTGDHGGNIQRALKHFPWPDMAERFLDDFFIQGGKSPKEPFKLLPMTVLQMKRSAVERLIVANFVEVFLAKEGHDGLVGINYLEKIQLPTLPSLFGAMLANVDFVLMGGGIPISIPGILDGLSRLEAVEVKIDVENNSQNYNYHSYFDPKEFCYGELSELPRPRFLAIISSDILAKTLARRAKGSVDGYIVEHYTAGGHNAPPRKIDRSNPEPPQEYSEKDIPDFSKIKAIGRPFWMAGGCASPKKLRHALELGATGIQAGTVFAYSRESGMMPEIKQEVLKQCMDGRPKIVTDFKASSTGYPFKLVDLENTVANMEKREKRKRICDLGYLRHLYSKSESEVGYRCPAELVNSYLKKGGNIDLTQGKICLCNALIATIGLGQIRNDGVELPVVTSGDDFSSVANIIKKSSLNYGVKDVIDYLKS